MFSVFYDYELNRVEFERKSLIFAKSIFLHREILQKYYKNIKIILRKDNVLFLIRKCCKIKKIVIVVNTREEYEKWQ
jgi:hypothetical protein